MHRAPAWFLWTLAGAVFFADWLSKRWVIDTLTESGTLRVLGDVVRFYYVRNTGVAFGLFSGGGIGLSWVSVVALVAVLLLAFRPTARRWPHAVSLGLILGGALGNLFDRVRTGAVTDFIDVGIGGLRWYVFNLADAAITVGVLLWAAEILLVRPRPHGEAAAESPEARADGPRPRAGADAGADDARGA